MHYLMFATVTAEPDATSLDVRSDVTNRLAEDPTFLDGDEDGLFHLPLCDWFVIGGRWSGHLSETPDGQEIPEGERNPHDEVGHEDDAQIVTRDLYDKFLKPYEDERFFVNGGHGQTATFADLDRDYVSEEFIGEKWLVVVDYHS